jgi:peptide/nickel transport system ATP-binding protein
MAALRGIDLDLAPRETLCVVGESGCGKSLLALSLPRLLPRAARLTGGVIRFEGRDVARLGRRDLEDLRGAGIAMIFQDPMTGLNPTMTIGQQLTEVHRRHVAGGRTAARERARVLLGEVGMADPARRMAQYPHELSGGLRQRVMIAMALIAEPRLLIADEPTTALDATVQYQVLRLIRDLQRRLGFALLMITHDLGVVATMADRVAVMYAGQIVETGSVRDVLRAPRHPYTRALIDCVPQATPVPRGARRSLGVIPGRVPALSDLGAGCAFADRCARVSEACRRGDIPARPAGTCEIRRCLRAGDAAECAA